MITKLGIILLIVLMSNCPINKGNSNVNDPQTLPKKKLTIFLVDRSGSFHKERKDAGGIERNYFTEVCDRIKEYISKKADRSLEHILVKEISSSSFSDATRVAEINFAKDENTFKKEEPKGPYAGKGKDVWKKEKDEFMKEVFQKQQNEITEIESRINSFMKQTPSQKTDLINALKGLPLFLEKFKEYEVKIVIYSDFKDDQIGTWKIEQTLQTLTSLKDQGGIKLGKNVKVYGEYVSEDDLTPEQYEELKSAWQEVIKSSSIEMTPPPNKEKKEG